MAVSGRILSISEIIDGGHKLVDASVRTWGKLQSYDLEKSHICLRDGEKILDIDAKLVEPCNATVDSHWMFIGEIACDSNSQMYLKARVAVCIDALDFPCFRKALEIKRSYLCQKSKDL